MNCMLFIRALALALLTFFCIGVLASGSAKNLYLMFPSQSCSASLCEDRPVLATEEELERGSIGIVDGDGREGTVSTSMMRFTPERSGDPLRDFAKTFGLMGFTGGHWESRKLAENSFEIVLKLEDSKHARKEIHRYRVVNGKVENQVSRIYGTFDLLAIWLTILGVVALSIWFWRSWRRKIRK